MIPKLINENGDEITYLKDKIKDQEHYYSRLYNSKETLFDGIHESTFFNNDNPFITKLSEADQMAMEGNITYDECLTALKNMNKCKSPGSGWFYCEILQVFLGGSSLFRLIDHSPKSLCQSANARASLNVFQKMANQNSFF